MLKIKDPLGGSLTLTGPFEREKDQGPREVHHYHHNDPHPGGGVGPQGGEVQQLRQMVGILTRLMAGMMAQQQGQGLNGLFGFGQPNNSPMFSPFQSPQFGRGGQPGGNPQAAALAFGLGMGLGLAASTGMQQPYQQHGAGSYQQQQGAAQPQFTMVGMFMMAGVRNFIG
ncbi:MAG: hypothetical protein AB1758_15675 [Candidatus Eremiobacterota bacterium]